MVIFLFSSLVARAGLVNGESRRSMRELPSPLLKKLALQVGFLHNDKKSCNGVLINSTCQTMASAMHCSGVDSSEHMQSFSGVRWSPHPFSDRRVQINYTLTFFSLNYFNEQGRYDYAEYKSDYGLNACLDVKIDSSGACDGQVYMIGYTDQFGPTKIFDTCETLDFFPGSEKTGLIKHTCDSTPGSSGSPLFCSHLDGSVSLIGININGGGDEHLDSQGNLVSTHNWAVIPRNW
ncbi:MAG: hypothetical protein KDD50_09635 [Bdellovibrionales bacterium]|nr:hypothetical protein [Bdellovibrionales bacterium]